jgi:ABC-type lipoprotein export system ATPase subunit
MLLQVENATRRYTTAAETVTAVAGVSLAVPAGEFLLIRGRSGSGKTTLLNLMGGLESPSSGRVRYAGRDLAEISRAEMIALRRREIGFVFQAFALVPELTAWENVEMPLRIAGLRPRRTRRLALRYLDLVGLARRSHHYVFELSGGEQQRVAIARGLVTEPRVLFADEPTGELDQATSRKMVELFREAAGRGTAVCLTSHDPSLADVADRVVDLEDGRVVEEMRR